MPYLLHVNVSGNVSGTPEFAAGESILGGIDTSTSGERQSQQDDSGQAGGTVGRSVGSWLLVGALITGGLGLLAVLAALLLIARARRRA